MTDHHVLPARLRLVPMRPRDPHEPGRAATSLELFFDLVFVVAVSIAAAQLHHQLAEGHFVDGLFSYAVVFFGIWWAWMNYTWFASAYDNDDTLFRVLTMVQMGGVLLFATGIPGIFTGQFFAAVIGYIVMRIALVVQWIRAALGDPPRRQTCCGDTCLTLAGLTMLSSPSLPAYITRKSTILPPWKFP